MQHKTQNPHSEAQFALQCIISEPCVFEAYIKCNLDLSLESELIDHMPKYKACINWLINKGALLMLSRGH